MGNGGCCAIGSALCGSPAAAAAGNPSPPWIIPHACMPVDITHGAHPAMAPEPHVIGHPGGDPVPPAQRGGAPDHDERALS